MSVNKDKGFKKFRTYRKIDHICPDLKDRLDIMLSDTSNTYEEITKWLNDELTKSKAELDGEPLRISRSAIGRYALRTKQLALRYAEAMDFVKEVVRMTKESPDENINEGVLHMGMLKLAEKLATEDFADISGAKAMELVTNISRTKAYKDKVYASLKSDVEKGYDLFMKRVAFELKEHPALLAQIEAIAKETFGKMLF